MKKHQKTFRPKIFCTKINRSKYLAFNVCWVTKQKLNQPRGETGLVALQFRLFSSFDVNVEPASLFPSSSFEKKSSLEGTFNTFNSLASPDSKGSVSSSEFVSNITTPDLSLACRNKE